MTRLAIAIVLATAVLGRAVPANAGMHSPGEELGLALGAAAANLFYTPAKAVLAASGMVVGGLTGALTGGDTRAAYAVMVPAASGTYFLRPSNLDGSEPVEFLGTDYGDVPSSRNASTGWGGDYEAQYSM